MMIDGGNVFDMSLSTLTNRLILCISGSIQEKKGHTTRADVGCYNNILVLTTFCVWETEQFILAL